MSAIQGIYTAIITPFKSKESFGLDEDVFRTLIERQVEAGIDGLVIAGSTGEGQTLKPEEFQSALSIAKDYRDKIQIMASCGASATWQVIETAKLAIDHGAHSLLISSPAYNKPTQDGIVLHFEAISRATGGFPMMVYNIPGRTAVNISSKTMAELWKIKGIDSLKESAGDWQQFIEMQKALPAEKTILSGDDPSSLSFWTHGAKGTVSVLSNLTPQLLAEMYKSFQTGELENTKKMFFGSIDLVAELFCESNPIPVKWAVGHAIGKELEPRLPLRALSESKKSGLKTLIEQNRELLKI